MVSIAAASDIELDSVDIEQALTQADKLKKRANDRSFITPPPGSPDATDKFCWERVKSSVMIREVMVGRGVSIWFSDAQVGIFNKSSLHQKVFEYPNLC
jgi:hypothetical protein